MATMAGVVAAAIIKSDAQAHFGIGLSEGRCRILAIDPSGTLRYTGQHNSRKEGCCINDELDRRILAAQGDSREVDVLLSEYLPMVKKQVIDTMSPGSDYEDLLSTGMLAFAGAIRQYQAERGHFIPFARLCIRSRVLDELRKDGQGNLITLPLENDPQDEKRSSVEMEASLVEYSREEERRSLVEEIAILRKELEAQGIPFDSLKKIGPKQKRSQQLCISAAHTVLNDEAMRTEFIQRSHLLPNELAARLDVSPKTIETYRRYIVTLVIILYGDYPCIRAFLPKIREVSI